jgi:putative component of toxin-antitoxin plasmid stabilization module
MVRLKQSATFRKWHRKLGDGKANPIAAQWSDDDG